MFEFLNQHKKIKVALESTKHSYESRNKNNTVAVPKKEKTVGQRSDGFLATRLFNEIPNALIEINKIKYFKRATRNSIFMIGRSFFKNLVNNIMKCFTNNVCREVYGNKIIIYKTK